MGSSDKGATKIAKPYLLLSDSFVCFLKCEGCGTVKVVTVLWTANTNACTSRGVIFKKHEEYAEP